ncbi:very short patch repair endonuclease [Microbispora sp. H10830]|uniref:very short patch repair endonuclease n=1 Tax=Microbispora sp. H10830 TaxID=2729109 RepID=UPI001602C172|nr:very short patch repair endonuclease [Microbispora sp. H10830]
MPNEKAWASNEATRAISGSSRNVDTKPEVALRRAVHALGLRYQVAVQPLPNIRRTADLVFRRSKVAVFLDGCFWHGCQQHYRLPASNSDYWHQKVELNRDRDVRLNSLLIEAGWLPLHVWEHEDPQAAALKIAEAIRKRRADMDRQS